MRIPHTLSGLLVHMLGDALGLRHAGTGEGGGVRRARERLAEKIERHGREMVALKAKLSGDAAVIR